MSNILIVSCKDQSAEKLPFYNILYNLQKNNPNVYTYHYGKHNIKFFIPVHKIQIINIIMEKNIGLVWFFLSYGNLENYDLNGGNIIQYLDMRIFEKKHIKVVFTSGDFFRLSPNLVEYINNIKYNHFYIFEIVDHPIYQKTTNIIIPKENYFTLFMFADDIFFMPVNNNPINKILLSGDVSKEYYPERYFFKEYALIHPEECDILPRNNDKKYNEELNKYISCVVTSVSKKSCSESIGCVLNKVYEICATGSLLFVHENMEGELNRIGFFDNQNCVVYNNNNITNKINYILNNREIINDIRIHGQEHVKKNYTKSMFIDKINSLLNFLLEKN